MEKVVMAYSGGLDTTAALHWLKRTKGFKVIAVCLNLGQGADMVDVAQRAIESGADAVHVPDVRRQFVKQFCFKALRAQAVYEGGYMLSAALSRPLIATELVRHAHEEGARYVAHGAPPKGNDQFRFECSVAAMDPALSTIAPLREWEYQTREQILEFAKSRKLPIPQVAHAGYSTDRNLWGARSGGGVLDDPAVAPPEEVFQITVSPHKAPDEPGLVEVEFEQGEPVGLDGARLPCEELVARLEKLAGRHGVGRVDTMENRILGFKSREVYEQPAATVLYKAHDALEQLTLDNELYNYKALLSQRYAKCVYDSQWFSTLRESLDSFFKESQRFVTGKVKVELFKGAARVVSRASEFSIYDREKANIQHPDGIPSQDIEGYLGLRKLSQLTRAFRQKPKV
ncbi:MAG: argininosuccinate synthase [Planctomycetota bacterium]|nr:MAG: argininosuccinate synthase [Planctomycetota bacterium]